MKRKKYPPITIYPMDTKDIVFLMDLLLENDDLLEKFYEEHYSKMCPNDDIDMLREMITDSLDLDILRTVTLSVHYWNSDDTPNVVFKGSRNTEDLLLTGELGTEWYHKESSACIGPILYSLETYRRKYGFPIKGLIKTVL